MDLSNQLVNNNVAVYGTLRAGCGNHHILEGLTFKRDVIQGFKMYDLGGFPYVVHTGDHDDSIAVEVYEVPDYDTARRLDALEGYHHTQGFTGFYNRIKVRTALGTEVYLYVFPQHEGEDEIESGDWVYHTDQRGWL